MIRTIDWTINSKHIHSKCESSPSGQGFEAKLAIQKTILFIHVFDCQTLPLRCLTYFWFGSNHTKTFCIVLAMWRQCVWLSAQSKRVSARLWKKNKLKEKGQIHDNCPILGCSAGVNVLLWAAFEYKVRSRAVLIACHQMLWPCYHDSVSFSGHYEMS